MSKFGKGLKTVSSASCTGGKESDMPYHTGSKKNGGKLVIAGIDGDPNGGRLIVFFQRLSQLIGNDTSLYIPMFTTLFPSN